MIRFLCFTFIANGYMITENKLRKIEHVIDYLQQVPYDASPAELYSGSDLYRGYHPDDPGSYNQCYDQQVYRHFLATGKHARDIRESLARTLHDHAIHAAMNQFIAEHDERLFIGVMGGHALRRTDEMFVNIVRLSKRLTEDGFYMISGGGPGAMEATHLGAWMAGRTEKELADALSILAVAPTFSDEGWLSSAYRVIAQYPQRQYASLGIPTWLYGHEPSTPFATHIAKFFQNSIREDNILTLPYGGIIYTPGSAGTMQEVFQDAVQNHYLSFGFSSPMIFIGKDFWTREMPLYPLLEQMMETGHYKNLLLSLTDDIDEVVAELHGFRQSTKEEVL